MNPDNQVAYLFFGIGLGLCIFFAARGLYRAHLVRKGERLLAEVEAERERKVLDARRTQALWVASRHPNLSDEGWSHVLEQAGEGVPDTAAELDGSDR